MVTRIQDPDFETICLELGLQDTIIPAQTISRYLADMAAGVDILELSTVLKGEARFYDFKVRQEHAGKISGLDLPEQARIICYYREGKFKLPENDDSLEVGDEAVLICHSGNLSKLKERFNPETAENYKENKDGKT